MAKDKRSDLDGGVPVGPPQFSVTAGNVINVVEGLSRDAGSATPPAPGPYGAIAQGPNIPSGDKMPGGNAKALDAFFGAKSPRGGR